jgi:hypothetical protein
VGIVARYSLLLLLLLASLPGAAVDAQTHDPVLNDLAFGSSLEEVRDRVREFCAPVEDLTITPARMPVAATTEARLVCEVDEEHGRGSRVTLHFGDDRLELIELEGPLARPTIQLDVDYVGFRAAMSENVAMIADGSLQMAWMMPPRNMHAHPFLGSAVFGSSDPPTASARIPEELRLGATVAEIRQAVLPRCYRTSTRQILPPRLPIAVTEQVQIDCLGFPYAGFPRKLELVFADGRLVLAWILTGKPEESRVRKRLIEAYGRPGTITDTWEVFAEGTVLLRKDTPEVLFSTEELAALLMGH